MYLSRIILAAALASIAGNATAQTIQQWITTPDGKHLLENTSPAQFKDRQDGRNVPIVVNPRQKYQEMLGFGFALTGGSAEHLIKMDQGCRARILNELFGRNPGQIGMDIVRLTVGASDMNSFVFSYDDMPEGMTDWNLKNFSLAQDLKDVVPVMQEVLAINPSIWIVASPWSAPAWMKEKFDVREAALRHECYGVYADYLVKYVQEMKKEGIDIAALTIQNEPLNSRNTPSMPWSPEEQTEFIKKHLGPKLRAAGLKTDILLFDHNTDRPDYPLQILSDPEAAQYTSGSAFHNYMGDLSAMTTVHDARPDKDIYFTEQMLVERNGGVQVRTIAPSVERMIVNIPRNWSRNVLLWNLAADKDANPHTGNGGCPFCFGAITIDGNDVTRNLAYYTVAHASFAVPKGSYRISSTSPQDEMSFMFEDEQNPGIMRNITYSHAGVLPNVAFSTPDGKTVLIVANTRSVKQTVTVQYNGRYADLSLEAGAVGTFIW